MSTAGVAQPLVSPVATRVLQLRNFSPELRTRDLHAVLRPWEDAEGGYRIRWHDDTTAYVVFNAASVAKRAYIELLRAPPMLLLSDRSGTPPVERDADVWLDRGDRSIPGKYADVIPCSGADALPIISSVSTQTPSSVTRRAMSGAVPSWTPKIASPPYGASGDTLPLEHAALGARDGQEASAPSPSAPLAPPSLLANAPLPSKPINSL